MRVMHPSYNLVHNICRAWADEEQAHSQAQLIVRSLAEAGMLTDCLVVPNGMPERLDLGENGPTVVLLRSAPPMPASRKFNPVF